MNKIEIIRIPEDVLLNRPTSYALEYINFKPGDVVDRIYYDSETKEQVVRVIRAADED